MRAAFGRWSPAQLAHALGYRLDLRDGRGGQREAFLLGPGGREHPTSHGRACASLARLAVLRRVDPAAPPTWTPRALRNGQVVTSP